MRCPKDDTDLIEIERQGIEIDYCPTCKGVWLDRRELDELISRSTTNTAASFDRDDDHDEPPRRESRERSGGFMGRARDMFDDDHRERDSDQSRRHRDRNDDRDDGDRYKGKKKKSKKRGMLEDLFDF